MKRNFTRDELIDINAEFANHPSKAKLTKRLFRERIEIDRLISDNNIKVAASEKQERKAWDSLEKMKRWSRSDELVNKKLTRVNIKALKLFSMGEK